jgi:hypothetical protein
MMKKLYAVHYTEKGHGKIIKGHRYNGLRRERVRADSVEEAIKKVREHYVEDGIREIRAVDDETPKE